MLCTNLRVNHMYVRHQNSTHFLLEMIPIGLLLWLIFFSVDYCPRIHIQSFSSFAGCFLVQNMVYFLYVRHHVRPTPFVTLHKAICLCIAVGSTKDSAHTKHLAINDKEIQHLYESKKPKNQSLKRSFSPWMDLLKQVNERWAEEWRPGVRNESWAEE